MPVVRAASTDNRSNNIARMKLGDDFWSSVLCVVHTGNTYKFQTNSPIAALDWCRHLDTATKSSLIKVATLCCMFECGQLYLVIYYSDKAIMRQSSVLYCMVSKHL